MPWIQLTINTTNKQAEQLGEQLEEFGALSVTFQDTYDEPVLEPLPGETRLWGHTNVVGLFMVDTNISQIILQLHLDPSSYQVTTLADKNWEREWMDDFKPMKFGQRLWICPSWETVNDTNAVTVMLDPGLAFGTGTHPTTSLCLSWLDSIDLRDKVVIDYGCGSGILAIAALRLGAKKAIGIDIDPQALEASESNAKRNNVYDRLSLYLATDMPENLSADVLVANILAGPLKELKSQFNTLLQTNGMLAISGILSEQANSLCDAYQTDFVLDPVIQLDGWCRISAKKNKFY